MKITSHIGFYNQLLLILICINSAIILVPDKFKAWPIVLLSFVALIRYISLAAKPKLEHKKLAISIGFFIILIFSITYSRDIFYAFKKLETGSSLLVFPVIFYLIGGDKLIFNKKSFRKLKLSFIISLLFFLISTFVFFYLTKEHYTFKNTLEHYTNLVDIGIDLYSIHSIYLSIYIGIAIILSFSFLKNNNSKIRVFSLLAIVVFITFMAILNKKGPIIFLGVIGLFFLIKNRFSFKKTLYIASISAILVSLIVILPRYNDINKFEELLHIGKNDNSSSGLRLQIYDCAIEQITKSPIFGYGWGDAKTVLNNCYAGKSSEELLNKNYNSHNQYFGILLSAGILGFIPFLYYLFYLFKTFDNRNSPYLFFLILYFCLNMLTENILEREDGVIVFAFFINIFLFSVNENTHVRSLDEL